MKRSLLWRALILTLAATTLAAAQSQNQPLGDYARTAKKTKNASASAAKTVYDNDNIPKNTAISVVGDQQPSSDAKNADGQNQAQSADAAAKQDDKPGEKKDEPQLAAGQSAEERQKALDEWKDKLAAQKDKVDLLSRELDILQREHQLKAAEFYADTARRTQNPNGFNSDEAKFKQQIADKQKQLDDAKSKLTSMQDDARKSGAPNSITQ